MLSATDNIAPTSSVIPLTNNERSFPILSSLTEQTLEFEFGYSKYVNFQTITIQEMPERAPFGQVSPFFHFFTPRFPRFPDVRCSCRGRSTWR